MTFSKLATKKVAHHKKYSSRQGRRVVRVIQHHWAGTTGGIERLTNPKVNASAHYIITSKGEIIGQVPEEFRAWTSGGFEADAPSITFEIQNSGGQVNKNNDDPKSWAITPQAEKARDRLLADIAKRYKWGAIAKTNYRGHRAFAATACPGGYMWSRMSETRARANAILKAGSSTPTTPPVKNKTVWELADEVLAGLHGSGDARKKSLGNMYNRVQAEVNRRLAAKKRPTTSRSEHIAQLADEVIAGVHGIGDDRKKSLGSDYGDVQSRINDILGPIESAEDKNVSQLADEVLRGDHGSGTDRRVSLGKWYDKVQAEVNRRMQ